MTGYVNIWIQGSRAISDAAAFKNPVLDSEKLHPIKIQAAGDSSLLPSSRSLLFTQDLHK